MVNNWSVKTDKKEQSKTCNEAKKLIRGTDDIAEKVKNAMKINIKISEKCDTY
jgi:hypothetical protein